MAVDVVSSIEIQRPRALVAAFVSDPGNATKWYVNITSIDWQTPPPAVVGSRDRRGPGICHVHRCWPVPDGNDLHLARDLSGGTLMTLRNAGAPSGFGKVAAPMMASAMRRANQKDLKLLKTILEAS